VYWKFIIPFFCILNIDYYNYESFNKWNNDSKIAINYNNDLIIIIILYYLLLLKLNNYCNIILKLINYYNNIILFLLILLNID
jgi:purine-cytosine permease-like protein